MEVVIVVAVLHGCLLWQSKCLLPVQNPPEEKIGEVIPCVEAAEYERAAGISAGLGVELDTPVVPTPPPGVLAVDPNQAVGNGVRLIPYQLRVHLLKAGKICEGEIGQAPIERVSGDAGNAQPAFHIVVEGIQVLCPRPAAVEVKTKAVGELANAANVPQGNVETADAGASRNARKRIRNLRFRSVIVKAKGQIVPRSPPPPAAPPPHGGSAESVIDAYVQVIAAVVGRGHEMEVLESTGKIGLRNVLQKALRNRIDLGQRVVGEGSVGRGIDNGHRLPIHCGLREVPLPFQQGGHGRKLIEWILAALAVVVEKEKRLGATVIDLGNVQGATHRTAKAVLHVRRVRPRLTRQGIGRSVEGRIADSVINGSMRVINVETPPSNNGHGPARTTSTEASASASTTPAETTRSAKSARSAKSGIIDALLQFVSAHRVERV